MNKLVYLLWTREKQSPDTLLDALLETGADELHKAGARGCVIHARDSEARGVRSPSPGCTGREPFDALVSLWLDDLSLRPKLERVLSLHCGALIGYQVEETIYTDYGENRYSAPRDWPDGVRSPGFVAVTLLERPAHIPYEAWVKHWYERQGPVSELMQPRTRYVRNVVATRLGPKAPAYAGIVEEAFPSRRHIEDPYLFYGAQTFPTLAENMGTMLKSVTQFLELPRIQTIVTSEYFLFSPRTAH
jgi:hypothetical protein